MEKAKLITTCVFSNQAPPPDGYSYQSVLTAQEKAMYEAVADAFGEVLSEFGDFAGQSFVCYAQNPQLSSVMQYAGVTASQVPFILIAGNYENGASRLFVVKSTSVTEIKAKIKALLTGDFGQAGMPKEGGGGFGGGGNSILCKLIPPLCAVSFLPWLILATVATYKAVESRSTVGRAMWGVPAFLFWQGFLARGGVQQIQYWVKKL